MSFRDRTPCRADLLHLCIEAHTSLLLLLVLQLHIGEERVAARINVGVCWLLDENDMQFGAGAVSQLESGCSGELGVLGTIGCHKHGRGEDAHWLHLL